jgi:hypothetical protein
MLADARKDGFRKSIQQQELPRRSDQQLPIKESPEIQACQLSRPGDLQGSTKCRENRSAIPSRMLGICS